MPGKMHLMEVGMLELSVIRDTVMNVAEAITAALEIETEIINEHLEIIGEPGVIPVRSKL